MKEDQPAHMWSYWRDKYGPEDALKDHYPSLLAGDTDLQLALYQIKAARAVIEMKMGEQPDDYLYPET